MLSYEKRLATFAQWPAEFRKQQTKKLALIGQYAVEDGQETLATVCVYCKKKMDGWRMDDEPIEEHMKHNNNCLLFNLEWNLARRVLFTMYGADCCLTDESRMACNWQKRTAQGVLPSNQPVEEVEQARNFFVRMDLRASSPFAFCLVCGAQSGIGAGVHTCPRPRSFPNKITAPNTLSRRFFYARWLRGEYLSQVDAYFCNELFLPTVHKQMCEQILSAVPSACAFDTIGSFMDRSVARLVQELDAEIESIEAEELLLLK